MSLRELPIGVAMSGLAVLLAAITLNAVVEFARTPGGRSIFEALGTRIAPPSDARVTRQGRGAPGRQRECNRSRL